MSILVCLLATGAWADPPPVVQDCTAAPGYRHCLQVQVPIPASADDAWTLITDIRNMPDFFPEFDYRSVSSPVFQTGSVYFVRRKGGAWGKYRITRLEPQVLMAGQQVTGPAAAFAYVHELIPGPPGSIVSRERIDYTLPFGFVGRLINRLKFRDWLAETLVYAHQMLRDRAASAASASEELE